MTRISLDQKVNGNVQLNLVIASMQQEINDDLWLDELERRPR